MREYGLDSPPRIFRRVSDVSDTWLCLARWRARGEGRGVLFREKVQLRGNICKQRLHAHLFITCPSIRLFAVRQAPPTQY